MPDPPQPVHSAVFSVLQQGPFFPHPGMPVPRPVFLPPMTDCFWRFLRLLPLRSVLSVHYPAPPASHSEAPAPDGTPPSLYRYPPRPFHKPSVLPPVPYLHWPPRTVHSVRLTPLYSQHLLLPPDPDLPSGLLPGRHPPLLSRCHALPVPAQPPVPLYLRPLSPPPHPFRPALHPLLPALHPASPAPLQRSGSVPVPGSAPCSVLPHPL